MRVGAHYTREGKCEFVVWAPLLKELAVKLFSPSERTCTMERQEDDYWRVKTDDVSPGDLYFYILDGTLERPDPASFCQPKGVHGPSQIVDHRSFTWDDKAWQGVPPSEMICYELHVGTFTPEGTFHAILPRLVNLKEIGITAIEIMPVAQFPGERNWGYDGVYPFSVQDSYGGPEGLKRLVNACHEQDMAVILDVVYNHVGPEGNYLSDFGPYFSERYTIPWGRAINFDDSYCDGVRAFFIENALYWFDHYHIDALRVDAIHAIYDKSATPFLLELSKRTKDFSRQREREFFLIAESDLNDARVIRPPEIGGYGFDAQWCDDFHHALHVLLTGEDQGYYRDFGKVADLAKAVREGFVYSGQYSLFRKQHYGSSSKDRPADQFVVYSQNHDQIGNRFHGERLSRLVSFEALKIAAGAVLLSPSIPLLFMGEEYGEEAPFLYFVSHSDPELAKAVRQGRKEDFRSFRWRGEPPDPQGVETFLQSKIAWEKREEGSHHVLLDFYKALMRLRREIPALSHLDRDCLDVFGVEEERVVCLRRWTERCEVYCLFNFNQLDIPSHSVMPKKDAKKLLDSADALWNGPGTLLPESLRGHSLAVYLIEGPDGR